MRLSGAAMKCLRRALHEVRLPVLAWVLSGTALVGFSTILAGAAEAQREDRERTPPSAFESLPSGDLRSLIVLRLDCASDLGRREVTLFGNGTVRLRDGQAGEEEMLLGELEPEALEGILARLEAEDLSEVPAETRDVEGEWVERCLLELPLREGRDGGPARYRFSRYAALPLTLSRVVTIARELEEVAERGQGLGLPAGYVPRRGDVLERSDGARFRVVQHTLDGKGVELLGLDVPLTLYLPAGELGELFVAVVSRGAPEPER